MSDNTILEIVFRQEISEQDSKQDNNLNGSLHLCQMLLAEENLDMSEMQMDAYLDYVYQEEEKGVRFAVAEELVEDISEFTGDVVFPEDPVWHGGACWISKVLSLVLWGVLIICPVAVASIKL